MATYSSGGTTISEVGVLEKRTHGTVTKSFGAGKYALVSLYLKDTTPLTDHLEADYKYLGAMNNQFIVAGGTDISIVYAFSTTLDGTSRHMIGDVEFYIDDVLIMNARADHIDNSAEAWTGSWGPWAKFHYVVFE